MIVDTDEIFPIIETTIYIDLRLTTISVATEAATKAVAEATTKYYGTLCDIINSSEEVLDKSKLVEIIKSQVPIVQNLHFPVLSPEQLSPMKGGESTNNHLLCAELGAKAEEMGYTVTMNTSSIPGTCNSHSTKF